MRFFLCSRCSLFEAWIGAEQVAGGERMQHTAALEDADETLRVLRRCSVHLQYFGDVRRCMPAILQQQQLSQRLLLLYFSFVARDLLGEDWKNDLDVGSTEKRNLFEEIRLCYSTETGGFHPVPVNHCATGATLAMTQCALQMLNLTGLLPNATEEWLCREKVMSFVTSCQVGAECPLFGESFLGAFQAAPAIAEVDLRFTYSALVSMALLCAPTPLAAVPSLQDILQAAVSFIWRCWNPHEGGFGAVPAAESHGGMTFCAVASLALAGATSSLTRSRRHLLARYCTARLSGGPDDHELVGSVGVCVPIVGYQGRPQKNCDTCYTHWIGSTLRILQALDGSVFPVDALPVLRYIDACVEPHHGGICKTLDEFPEIVHTSLGLSGLLLHVDPHRLSNLRPPHPAYGCSWTTVRNTGLPELLHPPPRTS
ncbi:geranylgeranyltransferase type I beta subunit [Trypanosoma conorhini]|uniref:Geranylgeranyl transferase type II subunit beta n=1 Tax=Trypanosoma conorhini TaxID=83891 RepID=A0A3R7PXR2_9TRYP|nr:geranylgeranyltransferase type I beta subunit [Trypanosoma conorhini]RNF26849.1 geranylgeranyltransferase type I beta subunit [Trypanosoma conorhini]